MSKAAGHKEGFGALFTNDKDGKASRPDFTGEAVLNGVTLRIAGWRKASKDGKPYISLAFEPQKGEAKAKPDFI